VADLDVGSGFGLGSDAARVGAAILFLQASTNAMDVFSAVNSSPWTAENFGGDQTKAASVQEYVWHGVGLTVFYIAGASILARSAWPLVGGGITLAYMWWLYRRALDRGAARQSTGWTEPAAPAPAPAPAPGNGSSSYPWSA
jgi:hypothetical protein